MNKLFVNEDGIFEIKTYKDVFSKSTLYKFINDNEMVKIAPGVYALPEVIIDEAYILSKRCPKGVISHDDALYYHGLIDREPFYHSITIYTGYNPSRFTHSGYKVFTVKKDLLDIGKILVNDNFGNQIPLYDLERTICDLFRNKTSFEIQDFNMAIKTYISRSDKDLNRLMKYANMFKVEKIVKQYMEVMI